MRPAARFIRIVAIFLLIGPPAGVITAWVAKLGIELLRGTFYPRDLRALPILILLAYPLGGPFALACGIAHAVLAIWLRWNPVMVPLIASAVLIAVFMLVWPPPYGLPPVLAIVAPMFAASLICWRLTRRIARAPDQSALPIAGRARAEALADGLVP